MKRKNRTPISTPERTPQKGLFPGGTKTWPYPDIVVMNAHRRGKWRWKYQKKEYYFGTHDDPAAALAEWRERGPEIRGEAPAVGPSTRVRVRQLVNLWLADKKSALDIGQIKMKTFTGYKHSASVLSDFLGHDRYVDSLMPEDFARVLQGYKVGPYRRKDFVITSLSIFAWAYEANIIAREPSYGSTFRAPSMKEIREHRKDVGPRDLSAADVLALLRVTRRAPVWHAMVWLGINCSMGNAELADLPWSAINDHELRWFRKKTVTTRLCWLWPETLRALGALPRTPKQKLVFPDMDANRITHGWRVVFDLAGLTDAGGQYDLRRTFATVSASSADVEARKLAMGHALPNIDDTYIQRFPVNRVRAISLTVRAWLKSGRQNQKAL